MKKITIAVAATDLSRLLQYLSNKSQFSSITDGITQGIALGDKTELIMADVKATISRLMGIPTSQINASDDLANDLHMLPRQIKSMAMSFTKTADRFKKGAKITGDECAQQSTVQDCVTLIESKI